MAWGLGLGMPQAWHWGGVDLNDGLSHSVQPAVSVARL